MEQIGRVLLGLEAGKAWRMQLAARLPDTPGVRVAQAGAEVGYGSEAAFNRAFKNLVGLPPGTWRKGHATGVVPTN